MCIQFLYGKISMEKFIAENPALAVAFIGLLMVLLGWFIRSSFKDSKDELKKHQEEIDKVSDRTSQIENNYKKEFKEVRADANKNHLEVLEAIANLALSMKDVSGEVRTQTKLCAQIQAQKLLKDGKS
jgi:methyl-accepting chemotaxis protein